MHLMICFCNDSWGNTCALLNGHKQMPFGNVLQNKRKCKQNVVNFSKTYFSIFGVVLLNFVYGTCYQKFFNIQFVDGVITCNKTQQQRHSTPHSCFLFWCLLSTVKSQKSRIRSRAALPSDVINASVEGIPKFP